jgi:hypothetical protein
MKVLINYIFFVNNFNKLKIKLLNRQKMVKTYRNQIRL